MAGGWLARQRVPLARQPSKPWRHRTSTQSPGGPPSIDQSTDWSTVSSHGSSQLLASWVGLPTPLSSINKYIHAGAWPFVDAPGRAPAGRGRAADIRQPHPLARPPARRHHRRTKERLLLLPADDVDHRQRDSVDSDDAVSQVASRESEARVGRREFGSC